MKIILKLLNLALIFTFLTIAIGIAYITIPTFGNKALIVRTGSMEPAINVGSMIVVRGTEKVYKQGDIIAFKSEKNPNTIITHRISSVNKSKNAATYKTKGDANEEIDAWTVKNENVLGAVSFNIPYIGQFFNFVKSKNGFLTMIVFPAVFVFLMETINIIKEIRKGRKKEKTFHEDPFGFTNYPTAHPYTASRGMFGKLGIKILITFIVAGSILIPGTVALMSDSEVSAGNIFQASSDFGNEEINTQNIAQPIPEDGFILDTEGLEIVEPVELSPAPTANPTISPSPSPTVQVSPTTEPGKTP